MIFSRPLKHVKNFLTPWAIQKEVPVVILPPVGIVVVLVSVVLTIGKGSVVKLVNRYVGIMSEVRNVDLDTSTVDDITVWGILDTVAIGEPEGRLEKIQISMGEVVAFEIIEPEAAPEGFVWCRELIASHWFLRSFEPVITHPSTFLFPKFHSYHICYYSSLFGV